MTATFEHPQVDEQLNAYLDGELDMATRARVESHVATCETCQRELAELRLTREALRSLAPLRAPRPFTVPARPVNQASGAGWWRWVPWVWRLGSTAAAACLVIAWASTLSPAGQFAGAPARSTSLQAPAPAAPPAEKAADQAGAPNALAPNAALRQQRAASEAATTPIPPVAAPSTDGSQAQSFSGQATVPSSAAPVGARDTAAPASSTAAATGAWAPTVRWLVAAGVLALVSVFAYGAALWSGTGHTK